MQGLGRKAAAGPTIKIIPIHLVTLPLMQAIVFICFFHDRRCGYQELLRKSANYRNIRKLNCRFDKQNLFRRLSTKYTGPLDRIFVKRKRRCTSKGPNHRSRGHLRYYADRCLRDTPIGSCDAANPQRCWHVAKLMQRVCGTSSGDGWAATRAAESGAASRKWARMRYCAFKCKANDAALHAG